MAPIILYRIFSDAWLRVESRYFDGWRTAEINQMGLVQNRIFHSKLILFTSSFFSLTGMTPRYINARLKAEHGNADNFLIVDL